MPEHPRWIVREGGSILTIEVVAGRVVLFTSDNFVFGDPATGRDLHRKIGMALAELDAQQSTSDRSTS